MNIQKLQLNATLARILLSLALVLILLVMTAGFYMAYNFMKDSAQQVASVQADAKAADKKLQDVRSLSSKLEKYQDSVKKAEKIVAESISYKYQNQIINDITAYARQAGVGISSFTFQDDSAASNGKSSSSTATKTPATPSPSGAKSTSVSIQMSKDLDYVRFLQFLHLLEQNLTRMQVANISLAKGDSPQHVESQALKLELYLR